MCECRAAASDVSSLCPCFIVENRSPVWLECMGYCLSLRDVRRFLQPCADFFKPFRNLDKLITHGELDKFFTKPQPVLFSLIFYNIHIMEIFSQLVPSLIILILACFQISARWNLFKVLILTAGIAGGTLIQAGIFVFIGCTSIFMFNSSWLGDLYYAFRDFLSYPLVIFGKKMLLFLTCVLPLAFVNYYPARYILEKENKDALINFMTLPVSLVISVLICKLWKISCKHYTSSGS